jgi:NADH-quinone oxidoreductase subunit G
MTLTSQSLSDETAEDLSTPPGHVRANIDGVEVVVPEGTLVIRAAEAMGTFIPRFCDHPLLDPVAACRMCLVEIEGMPKPQASCAVTLTEGMSVRTQLTSRVAEQAQAGVMEFLLINHPLDCPVCDKGGECPLQNQAMAAGRPDSRFGGPKREFAKPLAISTEILLDRERCVSCARCTRFSEQIAGDPFIDLLERGSDQQVGIAHDEPFNSYFSGNTIQICPVGALTSASYRFRSRPFDLVSVKTTCEHCASGCSLRTDYRRDFVMRRLAWEEPSVNEDWNCDKGRFAFTYMRHDRVKNPLVRDRSGALREVSWSEAITFTAKGLAALSPSVATLIGGRLTNEDAYAYAKFTRLVLQSDTIDFRNRPSSGEEADFMAHHVAGSGLGVTYADLESAPTVLLVCLEPEDESPIVFLRLRKAARDLGVKIATVAPMATDGSNKMNAQLLISPPGAEAVVVDAISLGEQRDYKVILSGLKKQGSVILVGERAATSPGLYSALLDLAKETGAKLAWVPRRAGERGALDVGALAGLLPGGRLMSDRDARIEVARVWGVGPSALPTRRGRPQERALREMAEGKIDVALIAGLQISDSLDPETFKAALGQAKFVVSFEQRLSDVAEFANVVLPVATVIEKSGTFTDWEGRTRRFGRALNDSAGNSDATVIGMLAQEMNAPATGWRLEEIRDEIARLEKSTGKRAGAPTVDSPQIKEIPAGSARLATWHQLLDLGALQSHEEHLAGTRRPAEVVISVKRAKDLGVVSGDLVRVGNASGTITLPCRIAEIHDEAVWVPMNSPNSQVLPTLNARAGATVKVTKA